MSFFYNNGNMVNVSMYVIGVCFGGGIVYQMNHFRGAFKKNIDGGLEFFLNVPHLELGEVTIGILEKPCEIKEKR